VEEVQTGTVSAPPPGHALPLLLLAGFRRIVDDLHLELAARGHPEARPLHGFALQAVGTDGVSIAEFARRLGVTKQAAAKTAAALERLGYVRSEADSADRRVRRLLITSRGTDVLDVSAHVLAGIRSAWADQLGDERLDALESALEFMLGHDGARIRADLPGWLAGTTQSSRG
jgi:DNA-binding MarR family transcriptional regulator